MTTASQSDRMIRARSLAAGGKSRRGTGALGVLLRAGWCGLAGGLLEVGARALGAAVLPSGRLYSVSRHFVWAGPLSNLLLFVVIGLLLAVLTRVVPHIGGWLSPRLALCTGPPSCLHGGSSRGLRRGLVSSSLSGSPCRWSRGSGQLAPTSGAGSGGVSRRWLEWSQSWRARFFWGTGSRRVARQGRPLPSAAAPQRPLDRDGHRSRRPPELLRVPAPDHSELGTTRWPGQSASRKYGRPRRGRFLHTPACSRGACRTNSSPSWLTPLKGDFPTLAEYLGSRGYTTAGFVANVAYCSYATGLDRGFHSLRRPRSQEPGGITHRGFD